MDPLDISTLTIDESEDEIVILASDPIYFSDQRNVLWGSENGGFYDQRNPPVEESVVIEWDDYQELLTKQNQGYEIDNVNGYPVATQITGDTATQPIHYGTIADSSTFGHVKIGTNIDNNDGTISIKTASRNDLGLVKIGTGLNVTSAGVITVDSTVGDYTLPTASASQLGGVKVGSNLSISDAGVLSATVPTASASQLGGVKVGSGLSINNGVLSNSYSYDLPTASASQLGGVKVGGNLSISSGVLSASLQTPLIGGATGTGNAITELAVSGRTITPKKNKTFALANEILKTSSGYFTGNSSLTGTSRTLSLGIMPISGFIVGFEGSGTSVINRFNNGNVFSVKVTAHLLSTALEIESNGTTTITSGGGSNSGSGSFTGTTNTTTTTNITQTTKTIRIASTSSTGITLPAELNQHGHTYFYTFIGK